MGNYTCFVWVSLFYPETKISIKELDNPLEIGSYHNNGETAKPLSTSSREETFLQFFFIENIEEIFPQCNISNNIYKCYLSQKAEFSNTVIVIKVFMLSLYYDEKH